jgi:2'-hydroxyisoflavone reductase
MDLLIVGGTRFVGRHITAAALARGHRVTLLHRGLTQSPGLEAADHLLADRDDLGSALEGRAFDATIDVCAYWPRQVRSLAAALGGRGGHYVYISSISAYADTSVLGGDESLPLATVDADDPDSLPMSGGNYGPLKALCEAAARGEFGSEASLVVRPTYVVGPDDYTGRFTWWVDRISRGGEVACPGPAENPMQLVDARDQAEWIVGVTESRATGDFHVCTPAPPWSFRDMLEGIRDALVSGAELRWVPADAVGDAPFPLWGPEPEGVLALDPGAALATGLKARPFAETVRETASWMAGSDWRQPGVGVDPDTEARLLRADSQV